MNPITVKLNALKIFIILCILLLVLFLLKVYFSSDEDDEISYTENPLLNKLKKIELENKSSDSNDIEKILAPILAASDDQLLIDPKVILTTIRFMLEERDEDDPELIEFVRSLIVRPDPEKKLVLKDKSKYNSSHTTSSQYVHETLKGKRDGFFIEAGAHEGEDISNTLFFEIERGWTGILIEPVPSFYKELLGKNRNAFALNACIANRKPLVSKFRIHFSLSGRLSEMHEKHGVRMDKESGTKTHKVGYFPCFSLVTIMKALGVSKVDYFSLDVEGGELDVLKAIDFKQLDIKMFSVEHNGFKENKDAINEFMASKGYSVKKVDAQDGYYLKS